MNNQNEAQPAQPISSDAQPRTFADKTGTFADRSNSFVAPSVQGVSNEEMLRREIHNLKRHIEDYCQPAAPSVSDAKKPDAYILRDGKEMRLVWSITESEMSSAYPLYLGSNGMDANHGLYLHCYVQGLQAIEQNRAAPSVSADATLQRIADVFSIGSEARTPDTILINVENAMRRSQCLRAVEREFFMVPTEADDDYPDEEPGEECLLNWGADPAEYVEQFRAAIAARPAESVSADAISTLRDAVIDAADEWSQYVGADNAPRRCSEHIGMAFDAAIAAQSQEGGAK